MFQGDRRSGDKRWQGGRPPPSDFRSTPHSAPMGGPGTRAAPHNVSMKCRGGADGSLFPPNILAVFYHKSVHCPCMYVNVWEVSGLQGSHVKCVCDMPHLLTGGQSDSFKNLQHTVFSSGSLVSQLSLPKL